MRIDQRILKSVIATARALREARIEGDKGINDVLTLLRDVNNALDPNYRAFGGDQALPEGRWHPRHPKDDAERRALEAEKAQLSVRLDELKSEYVLVRDSSEHAGILARNAKEFAKANGIQIPEAE